MALIERKGSVVVIRPDEPLQAGVIEKFKSQVDSALRLGTPQVVIDLETTPLIDGAGLEWLLDLDERSCERGGCVRMCNANELCADILRITGVGASVQQFDDLTRALGSFA